MMQLRFIKTRCNAQWQTKLRLWVIKCILLTTMTTYYTTCSAHTLPNLSSSPQIHSALNDAQHAGNAFMRQLRGQDLIDFDPITYDYLNFLGNQLIAYSRARRPNFNFFLMRSQTINAFTFHGGYVGVHQGLITATDKENELAAVLAHEIAHIQQNHLDRLAQTNKVLVPFTLLKLLGAVTVGLLGEPSAGAHLATAVIGTHVQQLINYSRSYEKEADNMGIKVLARAGFDPYAMPSFFGKLQKEAQLQSQPPEYLLTHPIYETRIAHAKARARDFKYRQKADSLYYLLVRAKLKATSAINNELVLAQLKQQANTKRYQNKGVFYYGYAQALLHNKQYKKALWAIGKVKKIYPDNLIVQLALAEIYEAQGDFKKAKTILLNLSSLYPNHLSLKMQLTRLFLKNKQPKLATEQLKQLLVIESDWLPAYRLLAKSEYQLGKHANMHQALANWHFLQGDFARAAQQLRFALNYTKTKREKDRIKKKMARFKTTQGLEQAAL